MAKKTNCTINDKEYYRIYRKVGMKVNKMGIWVDDRKAFYGSCKREAEEAYQEYMERKKSGISSDKQVFGELADKYIYNVFVNDPAYADSTKQQYINAYNKHVRNSRLAGLLISEVSSMDIQAVYNKMDCAPAGLRNVHNLLRLFFKYLEREGICRDLTMNLVLPEKKPSEDGQKASVSDDCSIVVRSDDELKKIVAGLEGHRLRLLVILGIHTGCRISELLALSYKDISGNVLSVNKQLTKKLKIEPMQVTSQIKVSDRQKTTTAARTIPLNDIVLAEIEVHKQWQRKEMMEKGYRTEYLFTTSTGTFCDRRNVTRSLDRLYKRIGVSSLPFHVYRHTFGTNLCKNGVSIQTASKLLGHKDINMTAKYYIDVDLIEKQRAVDKLVHLNE